MIMVVIPTGLHDLIRQAKEKFESENGEATVDDLDMIEQGLMNHFDKIGEIPKIEEITFKKRDLYGE